MPLIDLKTNLKSIKYGHDRPGGGDSGQPYIKTNINDPDSSVARNFDDGFIRNGVVGAAKASAVDTLRISKFLTDAPKGPLFIAKQIGLQLSNPKLEVKKGLNGLLSGLLTGDLGPVTGGLLQPTRLYNLGINTLAQIPVNAFGGHLNRHGLLPIQDENTKYLSVAQSNNTDSKNNRLVGYKNKFKLGKNTPVDIKTSKVFNFIEQVLPVKFAPSDLTIDNYTGGPGSSYGLGNTLIKRYDNTEDSAKINAAINKKIGGQVHNRDNNDISTLNIIKDLPASGSSMQILNVEKLEETTILPTLPSAKTYAQIKAATKTTISGSINNGLSKSTPFNNVDVTVAGGLNRVATDWKYLKGQNKMPDVYNREDYKLLTIVFSAIDAKYLVGQPERWAFSAYMKGFKDTFNGTWNDVNYIGRSETFQIYSKFKREVSFNLDIPCFNHSELLSKHRALGQLASTTAGSYINNVMGGVFLQVNVGNYLSNEYAILNSLTYDIPDDSSWDLDEKLAMYIKASFNLTIIPNKRPEYQRATANNTTTGFFGYLTPTDNSIPDTIVNKFIPSTTNK